MQPHKKIAIDADGVLANFTEAFMREAHWMFPNLGIDTAYQPTQWDDFGPLTDAQQQQVWDKIKATPNWWMHQPRPYQDNVRALAYALAAPRNIDFYIVTSRAVTDGYTIPMQTKAWLSSMGVRAEYNYLGVIAVDTWSDKAKLYKLLDFDGSVDDKKETVEQCDKLPNHKAFLLDRAWNQDAVVKNRIKGLDEFFRQW